MNKESRNYSLQAMMFAMDKHSNQVRKYTGEPYIVHCAEVVGVLVPILINAGCSPDVIDRACAIAWLHDVMEDCGVTYEELVELFDHHIAESVRQLSDLDTTGNREQRKHNTRTRMVFSNFIIQTIKCCDGWSNAISIRKHDANFYRVYRREYDALLAVMHKALPAAVALLRDIIGFPTAISDYQVWMEGGSKKPEYKTARLVGRATAHSFKEAKRLVFEMQPLEQQMHWNKEKTSIWGCKLFRTEAEARKSFG